MQSITIDRSKPLREESNTGHNRWHPDIPPVIEVDEGEEVVRWKPATPSTARCVRA